MQINEEHEITKFFIIYLSLRFSSLPTALKIPNPCEVHLQSLGGNNQETWIVLRPKSFPFAKCR